MKLEVIAAAAALLLLSGCVSSTKPTQQVTRSLAIYQVTGVPYDVVAQAVTRGLQGTNADAVRIDRSFPPATLPSTPARLELKSPFGNSNLGALAEASGQRIQMPSCPGAPYIATGADNSMARYGEATGYYVCLWPHQGGVNLDIYTSFQIQSGGIANLGADIARSVVGDSSQFIQRSIDAVIQNVRATGATVTKIDEIKA